MGNTTLFNETHNASHLHQEEEEESQIVLFLMIILLISALLHWCRSKLPLPFTVLMFLSGLLFGLIIHYNIDDHGNHSPYLTITSIPPSLIFQIFLPVLIFEGAQGMKLRVLSKVFWPALLVAGPGLLFHVGVVGLFLKPLYPDWGWWAPFLLAALLSATDPVAVIAVLKDLDADNRVTHLIDGEAILNDGTAIILFTILLPATAASGIEDPTALSWKIPLLLFAAPLFGTLVGIIMRVALQHTHQNPLVEAVLTLSVAYVSFIIAEHFLLTSGVVTLAALGFHLAAHTGVTSKRHSEMAHHAWEVFVFIANAVIFALVGIFIGKDAIPSANANDWWKLIVLYIALHVIRAIMIFLSSLVLRCGSDGYKLTLPHCALLIYGAMRGGVSLTLALVVSHESEIPQETRNSILFLTGGIVILCICVNGTTAKYLVEYLGLNTQDDDKKFALQKAEMSLRHNCLQHLRKLRGSGDAFRHVNWAVVLQNTIYQFEEEEGPKGWEIEMSKEEIERQLDGRGTYNRLAIERTTSLHNDQQICIERTPESASADSFQKKSKKIVPPSITRLILKALKTELYSMRELGAVSLTVFEELLHSIDKHIDCDELLSARRIVSLVEATQHSFWERHCCHSQAGDSQPVQNEEKEEEMVLVHSVYKYEMVSTYVLLLRSVIETVRTLASRDPNTRNQLKSFDMELSNAEIALQAVEGEESRHRAQVGLQTKRTILSVLEKTEETLERMHQNYGLGRGNFQHFEAKLSNLMHNVAYHIDPLRIKPPTEKEIFCSCSLFRTLPREEVESLFDICKLQNRIGQIRQHNKIVIHGVCIIIEGVVIKKERPKNYEFYACDFFGVSSVIAEWKHFEYEAKTRCTIVSIPNEQLALISVRNEKFLLSIWKMLGMRYAEFHLSMYYPYCCMDLDELKRMTDRGQLLAAPRKFTIETEEIIEWQPWKYYTGRQNIVFLLYGGDVRGYYTHRAFSILPPDLQLELCPFSVLYILENCSLPCVILPPIFKVPVLDQGQSDYRHVTKGRKGIGRGGGHGDGSRHGLLPNVLLCACLYPYC